jgi:hypothetical protein
MVLNIGKNSFDIDAEATHVYAQNKTYDGFNLRENFFAQVGKFPRLAEFLARFGADISKPESVAWNVRSKSILYFWVPYVVCGNILSQTEDMHIDDTLPFDVVSEPIPDYMKIEDKENKFLLFVYGFELPWVLDEPYPVEMMERPQIR